MHEFSHSVVLFPYVFEITLQSHKGGIGYFAALFAYARNDVAFASFLIFACGRLEKSCVIPRSAFKSGTHKVKRYIVVQGYVFAVSKSVFVYDVFERHSGDAARSACDNRFVFEVFPVPLLKLFNASDEMLSIGVMALRIIAVHYLICGFCIIGGSACQALGKAHYSMIISIARQLVVLLPAAYLLSLSGNVNAIWWSFPIAELVSLALTITFMSITSKKIIKPIPDEI